MLCDALGEALCDALGLADSDEPTGLSAIITETQGSVTLVAAEALPVLPALAIILSYISINESLPALVPASVLSATPVPEPPKVCVFTSSLSPRPAIQTAIQLATLVLGPVAVIGVPVPLDAVPTILIGLVIPTPL